MTGGRITLCMIVKDEEDYLGAAISSLNALVDEIVVADTGSRDRSIEIARSLGAKVIHSPWRGDFSAARNASISAASGDWILILDADELISERDHLKIRMVVGQGALAAYQFPQWTYLYNSATVGWMKCVEPYEESRGYPGYIESFQVRLFPNLPFLRYTGAVHELLEPACNRAGIPLRLLRVPVHHFGKVRSASHLLRKAKMYLELGLRKAKDDGENSRAAFELAAQLLELRHTEEARKILEQIMAGSPNDRESGNMLGVAYTRLGMLDSAIRTLESVVQANSDFADAWNNLGVALLENKEVERARASLERAVSIDRSNANALANLALAEVERGRLDEALSCIETAVSINAYSARLRLLKALALSRFGKGTEATNALEELRNVEICFNPADVLHLSHIASELGVFDDFESLIRDKFKSVSTDRTVAMRLASLLEGSRRIGLAKSLLLSTIETHPCFGAAHNALGCILAREESYHEALKSFTAAVEEEPENTTFIKNLALACERLGMTKTAVECYTHLAGCDPASIPYARRRILSIQETLNTQSTL